MITEIAKGCFNTEYAEIALGQSQKVIETLALLGKESPSIQKLGQEGT